MSRANEAKELADASALYEPPQQPELELHTDRRSLEECVTDIIDYLHLRDAESAISI